MANSWAGAANLGASGNFASDGNPKQRDRATAHLSASGSIGGIAYSSAQLSALIATFEAESDPVAQRDDLSRLLAYYAAGQATSVQDRSTPAHVFERVFKDADLLLRHIYGFFGPAGLALDRPTAELLFEFESLIAAKRAAAGLPKLPGTTY